MFQRAEGEFHAVTLVLYMARCQRMRGKLVDARSLYEQIVSEALGPGAPSQFLTAQIQARAELERLRRRIPGLVLTLVDAPADRVRVTVDGALVPVSPGAISISIPASTRSWPRWSTRRRFAGRSRWRKARQPRSISPSTRSRKSVWLRGRAGADRVQRGRDGPRRGRDHRRCRARSRRRSQSALPAHEPVSGDRPGQRRLRREARGRVDDRVHRGRAAILTGWSWCSCVPRAGPLAGPRPRRCASTSARGSSP